MKKEKGFTIIEVALVLAIAALIFLVVFLAVPALQRNQRNDAVKRDISTTVAAVEAYISNKSSLPTTAQEIYKNETVQTGDLAKYFDKPSNSTTVIDYSVSAPPATQTKGTIGIYKGYKCGAAPADTPTTTGATSRNAAVVGAIELGGDNLENYCQTI